MKNYMGMSTSLRKLSLVCYTPAIAFAGSLYTRCRFEPKMERDIRIELISTGWKPVIIAFILMSHMWRSDGESNSDY